MNSTVKVYRESLSLKTYQLGPADCEPPLLREFTPRKQPIYPYSTQELLTTKSAERRYATVVLENDFLKLTVLPELNGRLYSAFDKVRQRELFYANRTIRPGLFGLRGAWPAVGVEFNFPNSHTTTTMEPAHCRVRQNADRSAEIIVGDIECVSRMSWQVTIRLTPDSSAICMESRLFNPTDYPQRYYYWINAACPVHPETEFIYPPATRRLLTHPPMDASRLGYLDWPIHKGVEVRYFKNIPQHLPVFAENMPADFYGLYHHHLDHGLAHVADRALVRGRKLWMFGTARDGRIFIEQLADDGADYCELQTGPFSLQSDYRLLPPGGSYVQRDDWLPVAGTGGFNVACRHFAAKVVFGANGAVRLYAAAPLHKLGIFAGDRQVGCMDAAPGELKIVPLKIPPATLTFRAADGEIMAIYPSDSFPDMPGGKRPAVCGYLQGKYLEEQGYSLQAETVYAKHAPVEREAALAAARFAMRRGLWALASERLSALLAGDSRNAEALIYAGMLCWRQNDWSGAEYRFSRAADDNLYRSWALFNLARTAIMQGQYRRALEIGGDRGALGMLCRRKLNLPAVPAAEELTPSTCGEEFFASGHCDWPEHVVMESVCAYMQIRHDQDALTLLEKAIPVKTARHYYFMAWLNARLRQSEQSTACLAQARQTHWAGWFAAGRETEAVLRWVLDSAPDDQPARYHLGCLLAADDRWDEAAECWRKIDGAQATVAMRNLGLYYWKILCNPGMAKACYTAALKGNAAAKTVLETAALLDEMDEPSEQLDVFRNRIGMVEQDCRIKLAYIRALLANRQADQAARIFAEGEFRLSEGIKIARELYVRTYRQLAEQAMERGQFAEAAEKYLRAAAYPENAGIGQPAGNCDAELFYLAGQAFAGAGLVDQAKNCFERGAAPGHDLGMDFFPIHQLVWEASPPVDINQTNEKFQALCRMALKP